MALGLTRRAALATGAGLALGTSAAAQPPASLLTLRGMAGARGLLSGAAVEPQILQQDPEFAVFVQNQCSDVTPENVMKWLLLRPSPGVFDFGWADWLVTWARARNIAVHGHCLLWHEANPAWLPRTMGRAQALDLMQEHIARVVGRYAGKVHSWDVVIEFIERADLRPDGLRRSVWMEAIGPDYLDLALRAAHAADPAARLDLEDYGLEYDDIPWMRDKRASMLEALGRLKAGGAPLHALGIQAHLLGDHPPSFGAGLRQFLRQVADLGLEIYITELDVKDQAMAGSPAARDVAVADIYRRFQVVVLEEPAV